MPAAICDVPNKDRVFRGMALRRGNGLAGKAFSQTIAFKLITRLEGMRQEVVCLADG
jgi:hypothetical protein